MATKFSCHSLCDGIVLHVFSCADNHDTDVRNISPLECVCVHMYRSKDKISIGNCRCKCESCPRLNRVVECVCCTEIDCVVAKNNEAVEAEGLAEPPVCTTHHPGFHAVCLNRWVLQTAWYQYKQQYQDSYEGPSHKQNRHRLQAVDEVVLGSFGKRI